MSEPVVVALIVSVVGPSVAFALGKAFGGLKEQVAALAARIDALEPG